MDNDDKQIPVSKEITPDEDLEVLKRKSKLKASLGALAIGASYLVLSHRSGLNILPHFPEPFDLGNHISSLWTFGPTVAGAFLSRPFDDLLNWRRTKTYKGEGAKYEIYNRKDGGDRVIASMALGLVFGALSIMVEESASVYNLSHGNFNNVDVPDLFMGGVGIAMGLAASVPSRVKDLTKLPSAVREAVVGKFKSRKNDQERTD